MDDALIIDQYILTSEIREWPVEQLEENIEYHLCQRIEEGLIELENISFLSQGTSLTVKIEVGASAKYWQHLFTLHSYLEGQHEVVTTEKDLHIYGYDTEDPNNMFIIYGFTEEKPILISSIIDKALHKKAEIEKKTLENLIKKATNLIKD